MPPANHLAATTLASSLRLIGGRGILGRVETVVVRFLDCWPFGWGLRPFGCWFGGFAITPLSSQGVALVLCSA